MQRFEGRVALITGGAGGIGGATARRMAAEGAKVVIADMTDEAGKALAGEIGATYRHLDVTSEDAWSALVDAVVAEHGRIDVLVNAAGIEGPLDRGKLETELGDFRKVMAVNLEGTLIGCLKVMPHMVKAGKGAIVNLASIITFMGTPSALAYGCSKAGVEQLTRSLALIGAENGARVRVNSVHPGVITTRMTKSIVGTFAEAAGISFDEALGIVNEPVPFKEHGKPEDVAGLITYLASDDAAYVTGSAHKVDGGWSVISAG